MSGESKPWVEGSANMDAAVQGLQNNPTKSGNQLAKGSGKLENENLNIILLQCIDDILPATNTEGSALVLFVSPLNSLHNLDTGCQRKWQKQGKNQSSNIIWFCYVARKKWPKTLGSSQKEVICQTLEPRTVQDL